MHKTKSTCFGRIAVRAPLCVCISLFSFLLFVSSHGVSFFPSFFSEGTPFVTDIHQTFLCICNNAMSCHAIVHSSFALAYCEIEMRNNKFIRSNHIHASASNHRKGQGQEIVVNVVEKRWSNKWTHEESDWGPSEEKTHIKQLYREEKKDQSRIQFIQISVRGKEKIRFSVLSSSPLLHLPRHLHLILFASFFALHCLFTTCAVPRSLHVCVFVHNAYKEIFFFLILLLSHSVLCFAIVFLFHSIYQFPYVSIHLHFCTSARRVVCSSRSCIYYVFLFLFPLCVCRIHSSLLLSRLSRVCVFDVSGNNSNRSIGWHGMARTIQNLYSQSLIKTLSVECFTLFYVFRFVFFFFFGCFVAVSISFVSFIFIWCSFDRFVCMIKRCRTIDWRI